MVTPLAGVWVEIVISLTWYVQNWVTPLAGVWVEIGVLGDIQPDDTTSLPLRECGLKFQALGADGKEKCHSPCGSVG